MPEITQETNSTPPDPSWRIRDAAENIIKQRLDVSAWIACGFPLTAHFDIDSTLERVVASKRQLLCQTFNMAATRVVEAIKNKEDDEEEHIHVEVDGLPSIFRAIEQAEDLRIRSLESTTGTLNQGKSIPQKPTVEDNKKNNSSQTLKAPKFTRITQASSTAALDTRLSNARAVFCAAGNLMFNVLTPSFDGKELDVLDIPQIPDKADADTTNSVLNLQLLRVEAKTIADRAISTVQNARHRTNIRYSFRKQELIYGQEGKYHGDNILIRHPFAWGNVNSFAQAIPDPVNSRLSPNQASSTQAWSKVCRPRFLEVLKAGAGHAVYFDTQWSTRHGRIADLFRTLVDGGSYGPHLIITTSEESCTFAAEFDDISVKGKLFVGKQDTSLKCMSFVGSPSRLTALRQLFSGPLGLHDSAFHVIVTSYACFLEFYVHFCQIPFECIYVDKGVEWMAIANDDPTGLIGQTWKEAFWSSSDEIAGLTGCALKQWDFMNDNHDTTALKDAWIGLTARHRIISGQRCCLNRGSSTVLVPVPALLDFLVPCLASTVRDDWDRSRVTQDKACMDHFRRLLTRSIVVHEPTGSGADAGRLAIRALTGEITIQVTTPPLPVPKIYDEDHFIAAEKISFARRSALQWFGKDDDSWLRYEFANARLQEVIDHCKASIHYGHFCENITSASSTTTTGATGQITGTLAYRLALRCGRQFGSEQGLHLHMTAMHGPPGTWVCRSCGGDCMTSQARTHHERACGQPSDTQEVSPDAAIAPPSIQITKPGKKTKNQRPITMKSRTSSNSNERGADGSIPVTGYRGVWIDQSGKHFVKVDRKPVLNESSQCIFFDNPDEAAKKYDSLIGVIDTNAELNFDYNGTRIRYDDPDPTENVDETTNSVQALATINIKDLPPHVKPLLRDPRQTSRTGGNSKRHVYAYRGVCRQARKGHDRWQSQISFMGVNHYLGTFDSEWDAAAVYAWAHLILYGEEATKQAQKEGEEAAAAYEREQVAAAAGIPTENPNSSVHVSTTDNGSLEIPTTSDKKKRKSDVGDTPGKKTKSTKGISSTDDVQKNLPLAKGVTKAPVLGYLDDLDHLDNTELQLYVAERLVCAQQHSYHVHVSTQAQPTSADEFLRPCLPMLSTNSPLGGALFIGLSAEAVDWNVDELLMSISCPAGDLVKATKELAVEYNHGGRNELFRSALQGSFCIVGCASRNTQDIYSSLGLGSVPIGGCVGHLDCHIGGLPEACSERAVCIRYNSNSLEIRCENEDDLVVVNGLKLTPEKGFVPLSHEDICCIGLRVFIVMVPA